jgi:outer membrane protein OmpA-like peptidoglycan-associated protein
VVDSSGPLELQGIEARIRDVVRRTLTLSRPAPGRRVPNPFREEIYAALIRSPGPQEPTARRRSYDIDLDGNGRPDPEKLVVVNRVRRVERGPVTRGGPSRFDFRSYAGWELYVGDQERPVLARPTGRLKFCLVGDTDGDGLPDMILVEDHAEGRVHHDPYEPIHEAFLRPAVYFLDGQDMARGGFDLGPVRFDYPPGADGSEIRSLRFVPRHGAQGFADWDVAVEVFDPVGRLLDRSLVFDRFPSNRRSPTTVGFQRAEFAGSHLEAMRGVRFRVHFAVNDDVLDATAQRELQRAMKEVGAGAVMRARIVGHTCEAQSYAHNLALGRRRARSVASWLAAQGIHPDRMTVDSRGEYDPVESNTNPSGQSMNRRVDGWLMVRPAAPSTPPWYGRVGVASDPDVRTRRRGFRN